MSLLLTILTIGIALSSHTVDETQSLEKPALEEKQELYQQHQNDIKTLEQQNELLQNRREYQDSEQFLDKYAKTNLNKLNKGEKLVRLSGYNDQESLPPNAAISYNAEIFESKEAINGFFAKKGQILIKSKDLNAREYHVQRADGIWIWFDLMVDIKAQLDKLTILDEMTEVEPQEYIDLRILEKIIYK